MSAANPVLDQTGAGRISLHLRRTIIISAPIAAALLSEIGMGLISTLMLGRLGPQALAAGGLAVSVFITALLILQGALSGVGVLAAHRLGAGRPDEVPPLYWSGVALAVLLAAPLFAALSAPASAWRALGQAPVLAHDLSAYLHILRWAVPAGVVGVGMMRGFLPAIGLERVLLYVLPAGVVLHAGLSRLAISGGFGLPGSGVPGSAIAIVVTLSVVASCMLALLHGPNFRRFVRLAPPDLAVMRRLLVIGLPVAGSVVVEAGLFLAVGFLAASLGPNALARAHDRAERSQRHVHGAARRQPGGQRAGGDGGGRRKHPRGAPGGVLRHRRQRDVHGSLRRGAEPGLAHDHRAVPAGQRRRRCHRRLGRKPAARGRRVPVGRRHPGDGSRRLARPAGRARADAAGDVSATGGWGSGRGGCWRSARDWAWWGCGGDCAWGWR